ncbi:hypothetical protein NQ318_015381 [Aromia moschata]|uniref:Uncharacterized protein n=1 Tax=Aromia moschata TaxID=1265417 RepID=A0AAV8YMU6_9CUCU|nr:hypothetical protein NQ318_015381 [Aromia moschata]
MTQAVDKAREKNHHGVKSQDKIKGIRFNNTQVRRCAHSLRKKSNCSVVIGITHRDSHVTLDPTGDSRRTNPNHNLHTASRLAIAYKLANSSAVKSLQPLMVIEYHGTCKIIHCENYHSG